MGAELPKQYLRILGRTVIEHTIGRFLNHPRIGGVVVALAVGDPYWEELPVSRNDRVYRVDGGAERCHSVRNALAFLAGGMAAAGDWVLVHDAARPCLRHADIERMLARIGSDEAGGILAVPVRDTMKRAGERGQIVETVDRRRLWHALTPQMFRLGVLAAAIDGALDAGVAVTDEAQAMEMTGCAPLLVEGHADNLKITQAQDLKLAELFLRQQQEEIRCG